MSGSGISWAICKSAPRSRQTTTPTPHHSFFTGRMLFLPPNQQRQSTEGTKNTHNRQKITKTKTTDTAAHKIWNSLPLSLRTCISPDTFRRHPKTHYCQQAFHST